MNFRQIIGSFLLAPELRSAQSEYVRTQLFGFGVTNAGKTWRYLDYSRDAYKRNPVVYACMKQNERAAGMVNLKLQRGGKDIPAGKEGAALAPLAKLLKRPNPNQAGSEFQQRYMMQLFLGGRVHIHGIGLGMETIGGFTRTKSKPELYLLRPDRVKQLISDDGFLTGYEYRNASGNLRTLTAEEVLTIRLPDPENDFDGLSPMASVERIIDAHNQGIDHNANLLANSGTPSGLVLLRGLASKTPDDKRMIRQSFAERFGGAINAGKTWVEDGDTFDYKQMGMSPKELDWLGGKQDLKRDICAVLGTPSTLVGDPDTSTFANYEQAQKHHYTDTILPLMDQYCDELNAWLAPRYGPDISIALDIDHIPVLRQDLNELYTRLGQAKWMSVNDQRLEDGREPYADPEANKPIQLLPALRVTDSLQGQQPDMPQKASLRSTRTASLYPTRELRAAKLDSAEAARIVWERKYTTALRDYWQQQKARVLGSGSRLHVDSETQHFVDALMPMMKRAWSSFGTAAVGEAVSARSARGYEARAGIKFVWNIEDYPDLKKHLANDLADRSKLINQTTANKIQDTLTALEADGKGIGDMTAALDQMYEDMGSGRAENIARTEMVRAQSSATDEAWSDPELGLDGKEWIAELDDRVRDTHAEADGQVVGIGEDFQVGGDSMSGPGMGSLPEESCNCRCSMAPVAA